MKNVTFYFCFIGLIVLVNGCGGDDATTSSSSSTGKLLLTAPSSISVGSCSTAATVTLADGGGTAKDATEEIAVALTGTTDTTFFSDSTCQTQVTTIAIAANSSTGTFYIRNKVAEIILVTVSDGRTTPLLISGSAEVGVDAREWTVATAALDSASGATSNHQIATNQSSAAAMVFEQVNGTTTDLWASLYSNDAWGAVESIASGTDGAATSPSIAMDSDGNVMVVFLKNVSGRLDLYSTLYTVSTNTWSTASALESDNSGNVATPQVYADSTDNFHAIWTQVNSAAKTNAYYLKYTAGTGWGISDIASPLDTADGAAVNPRMTISSDASIVLAVWSQVTTGTYAVIVSKTKTAASWGVISQIGSHSAGNSSQPRINFDANGNALAIWIQNDGAVDNIWGSRYDATDGWLSSPYAALDSSSTSTSSHSLAVAPSGDAAAIWISNTSLYASLYNNEARGWGAERVIDNSTSTVYTPKLSADTTGNLLALWNHVDSSSIGAHYSRFYVAGAGWSDVELVSTDTTSVSSPQVNNLGGSKFLATWVYGTNSDTVTASF